MTIAEPQRQTTRLSEIARLAKLAKQFQRTDYGGRDQIDAIYDYIDKEIIGKGAKLSQNARYLVARAIKKMAQKQVSSCRKRTDNPLNEIIRLSGG